MQKTIDCIEMKRRAQERIYEQTRHLSREEELAFFKESAEAFRAELRALRASGPPRQQTSE